MTLQAISKVRDPGPLRVRVECELSAQDTVTLVLARGQAQRQPEPVKLSAVQEERSISKESHVSRGSIFGGAPEPVKLSVAQEEERSISKESRHVPIGSVFGGAPDLLPLSKRQVPSQTTTPQRARASLMQFQASSSNDSFDVRLWTRSPCSKGPTLLSGLPQVVPKVEKKGPTTSNLLAEKAVRHEDLFARAEASLWAARANFALHARFCMNTEMDEIRGNIAGPKRQVFGGGTQKTKLGLGAPKTAR